MTLLLVSHVPQSKEVGERILIDRTVHERTLIDREPLDSIVAKGYLRWSKVRCPGNTITIGDTVAFVDIARTGMSYF